MDSQAASHDSSLLVRFGAVDRVETELNIVENREEGSTSYRVAGWRAERRSTALGDQLLFVLSHNKAIIAFIAVETR
jgi:hypothetical protein